MQRMNKRGKEKREKKEKVIKMNMLSRGIQTKKNKDDRERNEVCGKIKQNEW